MKEQKRTTGQVTLIENISLNHGLRFIQHCVF